MPNSGIMKFEFKSDMNLWQLVILQYTKHKEKQPGKKVNNLQKSLFDSYFYKNIKI